MTGFLNRNLLRAHTAPQDRWPDRRPAAPVRPRLVAQWECTPEGRLVCRWRTEDRTEPVTREAGEFGATEP
jgi:hypothetical protein